MQRGAALGFINQTTPRCPRAEGRPPGCRETRPAPAGPTGCSPVTGSFLTGNESVVLSFGPVSHGPSGGSAPDAPLGAGLGRGGPWATGGSSGSPLFSKRGVGREPPVSAPVPSLPPRRPSPPHREEAGARSPPPGRGACAAPLSSPTVSPGSPRREFPGRARSGPHHRAHGDVK